MKGSMRWMVVTAAILVLVAAAFTLYRVRGDVGGPPPAAGESITPRAQEVIAVSSSVMPFSEGLYVGESKLIVVGTVARFLPSLWDDNMEDIYTPVVVAVERQIKGSLSEKELTVYQRGGTVGSTSMVVSEATNLEQGKRYLFFLGEVPRQKTRKLRPLGGHIGAVWLEGDLALPNRGAPAPSKPEPLGQLIANIELAMRGLAPTPTPIPTLGPIPTPFPSGGLYPPKPPRPVKPGE